MGEVINIKSVKEAVQVLAQRSERHPHIDIVDFSNLKSCSTLQGDFTAELYVVLIKEECTSMVKYGRKAYDFGSGIISFFAPHQLVTLEENDEAMFGEGWGIYFHPSLLQGTPLALKIESYGFFEYDLSESLHVSQVEKNVLLTCLNNLDQELSTSIDVHSDAVLTSALELILNYSNRFYSRQFISRAKHEKGLVVKFDEILNKYMNSNSLIEQGMPSVTFCAQELHLSPGYLSDFLKKETGQTAQAFIHQKLAHKAKTLLTNTELSIKEIAYSLGFNNTPYFSRFFKQKIGVSPSEFRRG